MDTCGGKNFFMIFAMGTAAGRYWMMPSGGVLRFKNSIRTPTGL
jgi:hypothetical protein